VTDDDDLPFSFEPRRGLCSSVLSVPDGPGRVDVACRCIRPAGHEQGLHAGNANRAARSWTDAQAVQ
jgi:hypothetical protein